MGVIVLELDMSIEVLEVSAIAVVVLVVAVVVVVVVMTDAEEDSIMVFNVAWLVVVGVWLTMLGKEVWLVTTGIMPEVLVEM